LQIVRMVGKAAVRGRIAAGSAFVAG